MPRKPTPDILGSLLGGAKPDPEPEKDTSIPAYQHTGIPVDQPTSKPADQQAGRPARQRTKRPARQQASKTAGQKETPEEEKAKATYYLSPGTVEALEEAWISLRRMASKDQKARISKSAIVELAIQMAVEELEAKADKSRLSSLLTSSAK